MTYQRWYTLMCLACYPQLSSPSLRVILEKKAIFYAYTIVLYLLTACYS